MFVSGTKRRSDETCHVSCRLWMKQSLDESDRTNQMSDVTDIGTKHINMSGRCMALTFVLSLLALKHSET
jgi:hypothetical protein